jgi:hypothetical protein
VVGCDNVAGREFVKDTLQKFVADVTLPLNGVVLNHACRRVTLEPLNNGLPDFLLPNQ